MQLKFIGKDGSMGLIRNCIYDVKLQSRGQYIWLYVDNWFKCPYPSLKALLCNWEEI